jgi:hypothetical protein
MAQARNAETFKNVGALPLSENALKSHTFPESGSPLARV